MARKKDRERIKEEITTFFKNPDLLRRKPEEFRKIKNKAMTINFKLGSLKKSFCQKCYHPISECRVRIKDKKKIIECKSCGRISRWEMKKK